MSKKVYLVSAGPGKDDLITVRGMNILKEADVVIYDYLVDRPILEHAKDGAELICCDKIGKKGRYSDGFSIDQHSINEVLIRKAKEGKNIVRLKNGDVSIFSRLSQELDALARSKIEFEIVPGVSAANAAACLSGIPLTDRRFSADCIFVTGHEAPAKEKSLLDWDRIAGAGTIVLYMAVENLENIIERLIKAGKTKETKIAIIQNISLPTQKIIKGRLADIVQKAKEANIKAPAIIIIGKVVSLEKNFNWLKKSKKVLFTGLSKERFFGDKIYFHLPMINIGPLKDYRRFDRLLKGIRSYEWVVFASRYGVEYFFKRLKKTGLDSRALADIKIAAIGGSTENRLSDFGIKADLVPKKESSAGLIEAFKKEDIRGKRIFLPRSDISDKGLKREFERLSARVTEAYAYTNRMPEKLPDLNLKFFDEVMFTSPSTVRNFKKRYRGLPKGIKVRCIGDVTLMEAKRCRLIG